MCDLSEDGGREGKARRWRERERLGAAVMSWMMLRSKTVPAA